MNGKDFIVRGNNQKCLEAVRHIKLYVDKGLDLYSVFAAYLFGVPYEHCLEYNKIPTLAQEGKFRRTISKKLLLANTSFGEMYEYVRLLTNCNPYTENELRNFIVNKFPYKMEIFCADEDRTEEDDFLDSMTFISWILGYVQISRCFDKSDRDSIISKEREFLDELDMKQIIDLHCDKPVRGIMTLISERYDQKYKDKYETKFGLFYSMTEFDFTQYVLEKYNIKLYENSFYYFDC